MKKITLNDQPFSLKNDGALQLFFVGTGSAFTKFNYQTNLLIIKGDDHLLVDCGTKCPQAFNDLGSSITEVQNFLITHSHADHIGGLEEVALMNKYVTKKKPVMTINETYQYILWEMSLRGGAAYNEENAGDILTFSDFFGINRPKVLQGYQRETLEANVGSINLKIFRTKHIPDNSRDWESSFWSCGVIIDDKVMYTSDTRFDRELVEYFDSRFELEAIFHDCQLFTGGVHASIDELNGFSDNIKRKINLVHYGDNYKDFIQKSADYGLNGFTEPHTYYTF
ncbi:MAG TPA: MBL fold metallo-hydrolase [Spirochaetota bacterium]|nr:MBL fold metallo-hydrolase [Spirochaetota bacterium]